MSTEENKAIVRRYFEEVCNKHSLEGIDEFIAPSDYVYHANFGDINKEGFTQLVAGLINAIPDVHYTIEDMIAEGEKVVVRYTLEGTQKGDIMGIPQTGKRFAVSGISIDSIVDNKMVESWDIFDMLAMMQQLGVIPPIGQ